MKIRQLVAALSIAACASAFGSVTLSFSVEDASNFSNVAGVPTDGLYYGVIIDTGGDGFSGNYSPVALALDGRYSLTTSVGDATNDVLALAGFQTYADTNNGTIYDCGPIDLALGVATGQAFRIVWFDGVNIGTLADASFTIPSDGFLQDYTAPFMGTDPNRSAAFSYSGTEATPTGAGFTMAAVPEPSAALLGMVGALGLLRRRRN